jgi:trehalose 6-phosphate synthase/phosphatase
MPAEEQMRRNAIMQSRLRRYDVSRWAMDFMVDLISTAPVNEESRVQWLEASARRALMEEYRESARRLLIFDYDGTLVPFAASPELATPPLSLLRTLRSLATSAGNEVLVATGRDRKTLDQWFNGFPMSLAAEHGAWLKERNGDWKMQQHLVVDWKARLLPILEMYADRVPGAFVEEKEFSLVWHYRIADPEQARVAARELSDHLVVFTASIDLQVLRGNKAIEIRHAAINKGIAVQAWMSRNQFDFILAIGDDSTDEDMFAALPQWAYSFRVGARRTRARLRLRNPEEVTQFLTELAGQGRTQEKPDNITIKRSSRIP